MAYSSPKAIESKSITNLDQQVRKVCFINKMNGGYGYHDGGEYATAIAASAFSINSMEDPVMKSSNDYHNNKYSSYGDDQIPISRANTRKLQESNYHKQSQSHGSGHSSHKVYSSVGQVTERRDSFRTRYRSVDEKADSWEISAMTKIGRRYDKLNSAINAWEKEKELKTKLEMEKKKRVLELKKELNMQHYQSKLARINHIAEGARVQNEEKRKTEESNIREKKKRMKSKGKVPFSLFCFSC